MTREPRALDLFDRETWSSFTAPKVGRICNTSGAGDAFAGGFLSGLMKGQTSAEAVCLGQLCAANSAAAAVKALSVMILRLTRFMKN